MSSQPVHPDGPLMPMPELNLPALRSAIAALVPSRLEELVSEMQRAFDQAGQHGSTAPIRMFYRRWGTVVAIERDPERAARFHDAMQAFHTSDDAATRQSAAERIGAIVRLAEAEVQALEQR
ncbi:hypothetical protein [Streptomyces olivaceiscleroticus]|uniref:Uncharacterized protein n=1 Tax=Streptomyces olivaceiscleroticus TaxID=68245 RepID=A0ABP3KTN2_9ACTN